MYVQNERSQVVGVGAVNKACSAWTSTTPQVPHDGTTSLVPYAGAGAGAGWGAEPVAESPYLQQDDREGERTS